MFVKFSLEKKSLVIFYLFLFTIFPYPGITQTTGFISVKAIKSSVAANAVGVNTHLNYTNTVYGTRYEDIIKPRLIELGTRHIRDHFGDRTVNERYVELAHNSGIKLLLISPDGGNDLDHTKQEIIRLNKINPAKPVVELIEPANERDNGWKQDWTKLCLYLENFNKTYKSDSLTRSIPLLGPSFANTKNSALEFSKVCKNAPGYMDLANLHAYSGLYPESPVSGGWGISLNQAIENYKSISRQKPIIETECGYKMSEGASGHPAVSEITAAKYSPRLVLERLKAGVKLIYFYQLINDSENFGLLNNDGTPRLQFKALKNFITLMKDEGGDFVPATLQYKIEGDTGKISRMLFQKKTGAFMLILWQGIDGSTDGYKDNDYKEVINPDKKIKLSLTKKAANIKVYCPSFEQLPLGSGTQSIKTFTNTSAVNLSVPDHILVVEINP